MRLLILLLVPAEVLAGEPSEFPANLPAKYRTCKADGDCAVVPSPCPAPVAVNRRYLAAARKLDNRSCPGDARSEKPICRHARCEIAARHGHGHRFTGAEEYAKHFDSPARNEWQKPEEVMRHVQAAPGMTVADIGAGTGYFEPYLSRAVGAEGKVLALDVEPDMVRYLGERAAREKLGNVTAREVAPNDPGLARKSVDRILIVDTWHHIAEREKYAARLAASLAPGGWVVIVDYTHDSPSGPPVGERLAPDRVAKELQSAGLETAIVEESLPRQYIVVGKLREAAGK